MTTLKDAKYAINLIISDILITKHTPWTASKIILNEYWGLYYNLRYRDKKPFEMWFRKRYDKLQKDYEQGKP
jgi:hypothetical protein